ncbi:hypothetical protein SUGI_1173530 [Cryptomeria japonica]|nr:hypothetical protein SUGI_1173530 [Cryptomeria japonica]
MRGGRDGEIPWAPHPFGSGLHAQACSPALLGPQGGEQRKDRGRGRAKEATSKRKISSSRMKVMAKGGSRACNFLRIG